MIYWLVAPFLLLLFACKNEANTSSQNETLTSAVDKASILEAKMDTLNAREFVENKSTRTVDTAELKNDSYTNVHFVHQFFLYENAFVEQHLSPLITFNGESHHHIDYQTHIKVQTNEEYLPILCYDQDYKGNTTLVISKIDWKSKKLRTYTFEQSKSSKILTQIHDTPISKNKDVEFLLFLTQSAQDSSYQLSHTNFPFIFYYEDMEFNTSMNDMEMITDSVIVDKSNWEHINWTTFLKDLIIIGEPTNHKVSREINLTGIENGISVKYNFILKKNGWHLEKVHDFSM